MYPPPPFEVVQKLKGNELELVSFGKYVIHLSFSEGNKLSFSAPFRFSDAKSVADSLWCGFPLLESHLVRAIASLITTVVCEDDGTLRIEFANDDILIVYANDPQYEAYTLVIDGKEYLV